MKQTVHIGHRAIALRVAAIYFLVATAWIVGSDLAMLLWLPESAPAVAGSIGKGMLFVMVTSVALYVLLRRVAHMESQPAPRVEVPAQVARAGWRALAPFLALALALICATIFMFARDAAEYRKIARNTLNLSADLKTRELGAWLKRQSLNALSYRRARFFSDDLPAILAGDDVARDRVERRLEEIRKTLEVDAILVLAPTGRALLAVGTQRRVSAELARHVGEVARTGDPHLHVLYRAGDAGDTPIVLDQIVPVGINPAGETAPAVLVLRDDAARTLFPMVRDRLAPSRTAETYLVRLAGERIEYLSELREKPGTALTLGALAADAQRASARLSRGDDYAESAVDYRGRTVLAAGREVPGTQWRIISKIDLDEVLEPAWEEAGMYLVMLVGLTLLAGLGANRLWRQQGQLAGLRERALSAERDAIGRHLDLLSRYANDMILLLDSQGSIVQANERAIERYGYPPETLIGMSMANLRIPEERAEGQAQFERVLREGSEIFEACHITASGERFPVEVSARRVDVAGTVFVQGVARDITERKQAGARIERLHRLRDALSATNRAIVRMDGEQALFEQICRIVVQRAGFLFAWIGIADAKRNAVQPAAHAGTTEEYLQALRVPLHDQALENYGLVRAALREGRPMVSQDFLADPRMAPWHELARKSRIASMATVPIFKDGRPYATLNVYSGQPNTFDGEHVSLLEEMAGDVSFALGVMRRDRELATAHERLELAMQGAGFGVWDWWDVSDPAHVWWSKRTDELAGLEAASHGYNVARFTVQIHPDDRPLVQAAMQAALRNEAPFDVEYRAQIEPGKYHWMHSKGHRVPDESGKVTRMLGVVEDIDVRRGAEEALHQSEQRLSGIINSHDTYICRLNRQDRYTFMNDAFAREFGVKLGDLSWANVHPDDIESVRAEFAKTYQPPYRSTLEVRNRIQGQWRWMLWQNSVIRDASGEIVETQGVGFDVNDRRRAEDALRESEQRFRAVVEQSIAAVYVIQDGKLVYGNPRMREIFGYAPGEPVDPDPMAHIAPQEHARVADQMTHRLREEPEAAYSVAALRKDGTPFTLGVHAKQASFDGRPAIIAVAQDITERARAEEEVKRYVARLEQAMHSTVNVVATIGELRDPYTHGHERRVGEIAAAIATELGLDANRVEGVRIAGYLHDVGKIGVPAEILSKPSRLTKAEFALVKDHAQQSYEILKGVEFPWPVAETAWQHHERLDGSGYPRGLKGDEIILEARVLAVADTVEAMSSHRPYRPGLGIDAALAEIEKCRGRLYDPAAVDACLRLFREKGYRLPS